MPLTQRYCIGEPYEEGKWTVALSNTVSPEILINRFHGAFSTSNGQEQLNDFPPGTFSSGSDRFPLALRDAYIDFPDKLQRGYLWIDDPTVKRHSHRSFSMKGWMRATYPQFNIAGGGHGKGQFAANTSSIALLEQAVRFSFMVPSTDGIDQIRNNLIFQYHGMGASPSVSVGLDAGDILVFRLWKSEPNQDRQPRIPIAKINRDQWYDMLIFSKFSYGTDGRMLVFLDGRLAKTYIKTGGAGNWNVQPAVYPTTLSGGSNAINTTDHGSLPIVITENSIDRNIMYFEGRVFSTAYHAGTLKAMWGQYKSSWTNNEIRPRQWLIDNASAVIANPNLFMSNSTDPSAPNYLPENLRNTVIYTDLDFGYVGEGETYEDLFKMLMWDQEMHPDDKELMISYDNFSWFTFNETSPEPTLHPLTITSTTGGSVSQDPSGTSFTSGTSITLTATASEGFVFSRYRNPTTNETLSTNAVYTFSKSASAQSIQAVFVSQSVPPGQAKKFFARKKPTV